MRCPECGGRTVLAPCDGEVYERVCSQCGLVVEVVLREVREK